ncbi:TlpA disulfide reductase family protein [Marinirhabdus gelatinilytica]|uniref:Peroxiredoxin n=1 Tax=Marinirhabdus gelatinilytica TaxID=1703343 RepID=A0A370QG20_9FLAO|nr:TlpA disulfide reductase family protein [Marinirhabdus gelatinilytica]RDK87311.1 peroxiredoxin [Marinirhabdus gelatinilytica]
MRKILFICATALLVACQNESDSFKISGTAQGFDDGTQILVNQINPISNQPSVIDTITITNGSFTATYPKNDMATINYLQVGKSGTVAYFPENEDLQVTIYKDSIQSSYVTGSPQNDSYREFVQTVTDFGERRQELMKEYRTAQQQQDGIRVAQLQQESSKITEDENAYKKNFIAENGNSVFSVMLISEMLNKKQMTATEAKAALDGLDPKMKESATASKISKAIESMSATDIGAKAPDFSAPTPNGEQLALSDALGKYTIIDFWASWCKPCRRENPNVVKVYEKYHDKGLNIISVSLDRQGQEARWKQAIADDNMDWYHVSNLKFWQDPIARQYNVRSIPATFLLDENGVIIDKNLRGAALENKIASLLE